MPSSHRLKRRAVVGLVSRGDTYALVRSIDSKPSPLAGHWHLPGGWCEDGEDEVDALRRELREELAIEIEGTVEPRSLGCRWTDDQVIHYFLVDDWSGEVQAGSDAEDVEFVAPSDLPARCSAGVRSLWPAGVRTHLETATSRATNLEGDEYLASSQYCDSDHPAIVDVARMLEERAGADSMGRIQAAFEFVRDHVQYRLGNWNRRASETLFEREGSCTNSANLFVAITRAMGIPAAFGVMTVRGQEYFGAATPPGLERWIKPLSRHVYAFAKAGERWMHVDPSDDSLLSLGSQHFNHQSTLVDFSRERGAILSLDESHIVNDEGPVASIDGVMGKRHSLRGRLLARIGNSYVQFLREEGAQCSSSGDAHERFPRFLAERRRFAEYLMFKAMTARSLSGERTRAQAAG